MPNRNPAIAIAGQRPSDRRPVSTNPRKNSSSQRAGVIPMTSQTTMSGAGWPSRSSSRSRARVSDSGGGSRRINSPPVIVHALRPMITAPPIWAALGQRSANVSRQPNLITAATASAGARKKPTSTMNNVMTVFSPSSIRLP